MAVLPLRVMSKGNALVAMIAGSLMLSAHFPGENGAIGVPDVKERKAHFSHILQFAPCSLSNIQPKDRHHPGGSISLSSDERNAVVADGDNDRVVVVSLDHEAVRVAREINVGRSPAQVVMSTDGRVFVTERLANTLSVYDSFNGQLLCRTTTAADPFGVALAPDEQTVYVTSGISHTLTAIDTRTFASRYMVDVPREPRGIAISADGSRAVIAHLASDPMSIVDLHAENGYLRTLAAIPIPVERAPELIIERRIPRRTWEDEFYLDKPSRRRSLESSEHKRTERSQPSIVAVPFVDPRRIVPLPSQAWSVAIGSMNGHETAFVPFMVNRTGREVPVEQRHDGYGAGSVTVVLPGEKVSFAIGAYDLVTNRWISVSLPDAHRPDDSNPRVRIPSSIAVIPGTLALQVASMGSNAIEHVEFSDSSTGHSRETRQTLTATSDETLRAPCGIAIARDGRELVYSQLDHAIELRSQNQRTHVSIGENNLPALVAHGRELFFSANDRRISSGGMSCGGCHPDGRDDGLVWFLSQGPRQTPMLAGRLEAPFNWNGTQPELAHSIVQTIHRIGGTGVKASEAEALAAYLMQGLHAPEVATRTLTPTEDHGRQLFETTGACTSCHDPDQHFVDRQSHVLGRLRNDDSRSDFDTPTLRFVGSTAPYFHDGRYSTLEAVLSDDRHRMGHVERFNADDIVSVAAYLRTL